MDYYSGLKDIVIPCVAALFGSLIGGRYALKAGQKSHENNLELALVQTQQNINGVLIAIRSELSILAQYYSTNSGGGLENLPEGQNYNTYFSLNQKYFIVYPNNTNIVGQIEDAQLVELIISTYNKGNFLIEAYMINNWYIDRQREYIGPAIEPIMANRAKHTLLLKELHKSLHQDSELLLGKIAAYLTQHQHK